MGLICVLVPDEWENEIMKRLPCRSGGVVSRTREMDSTTNRGVGR